MNDESLKEMIKSSASKSNIIDDKPTFLSLQDTVDLVKKKYGPNWMSDAVAKSIIIWDSKFFVENHVKEIIPDLYDLCLEYRTKDTVNGMKLPWGVDILAFNLFEMEDFHE